MTPPVIFMGPTLDVGEARRLLPGTYLPPVAQGDVLRVLDDPPPVIGIIDGYFELVPSVWHKEILAAMARGVRVFGAASMGALRAAELEAFGMEGVGTIFQWYSSGFLEDDDEVAVAHGPAESGFVPLSVAMVDVRDDCHRAVGRNLIAPSLAEAIVSLAKALYYPDRTWPAILAAAQDAGFDEDGVEVLRSSVSAARQGLKARDARALLVRIAEFVDDPWPPPVRPVEVEKTVFFDRLQTEIATMKASTDQHELPDEWSLLRAGETVATARKKMMLRLLARTEARRLGLTVTDDEMQAAADEFRRQHGLHRLADFTRWFNSEGLTEPAWIEFLRDSCLMEQLERHYYPEINRELRDYLRLASVRRWRADEDEAAGVQPPSVPAPDPARAPTSTPAPS